ALDALTLAIAKDADYVPAYVALSEAQTKQWWISNDRSWLQAALTSARRAQQLDHNHSGALIALGAVYLHQGEYDAAIAWFRKALTLEPGNASAKMGLARV